MTNEEILSCFWLPNDCYKTTLSGVNAQTIRHCGTNLPCTSGLDILVNQKINRIISESKKRKNNGRYMRGGSGLPYEYVRIVNEALDNIYNGFGGYVFSEEQAISVCSFLKHPFVEIRDGYIYISEEK